MTNGDQEKRARFDLLRVAVANPHPGTPTFTEASRDWLTTAKIRLASRDKYEQTLRRFEEVYGSPPLASVTRASVLHFIEIMASLPRPVGLTLQLRRAPVQNLLAWMKDHPHHPTVYLPAVQSDLKCLRSFFTYALQIGWIDTDPTIGATLPEHPRGNDKYRDPSLHHQDVPGFMADLRAWEHPAARCLEFVILSCARPDEARLAMWSEINLDAGTWTVPAERMKLKKLHVVPLSSLALDLLPTLDATSKRVFPGLGVNALGNFIRGQCKMGSTAAHGFRASFEAWAVDEAPHDKDTIEVALARAVESEVDEANKLGTRFAKRRTLMDDWAAYCASARRPPRQR
jgi:integrase